MVDIVTWSQSKYGFYVDRQWVDGRWLLQPGPIRLSDYHSAILSHVFTPDSDGRLRYDSVCLCEPSKSGKTALSALVGEFCALHHDGDVVMVSNSRTQASSLMYRSVRESIEANRYLPNVTCHKHSVQFQNGNEVRAIASSSRTAAGSRFCLAAFDEMWGMWREDSERLWSEHKTDPTRMASLRFASGVAGYTGESQLWSDLLHHGLDGEPVEELAHITNQDGSPTCWRNGSSFVFWSHLCRQPWQTEEWQERQRANLRPAQFRRLILTEFAEGQGDFVDATAWAACIDDDHRPLPPGSDQEIYLGLDLATKVGGDDAALIGVYSDQGKVKLALHKVWTGRDRRTDLRLSETVQPYILDLARKYRVRGVWYDPFQAMMLTDDLRAAGVHCAEVGQNRASRAPRDTALREAIINKQLVLYPHPEIENAAAFASAKELGDGKIFIKRAGPRSRKIDLLVSLSNVAYELLDRERWGGSVGTITIPTSSHWRGPRVQVRGA